MKFYHRILLPDGTYTPGSCVHGPDGGDWPTKVFGMPEDLTGQTVLDIGAYDGFFSFEAEKRGAEFVSASNPLPPKGPEMDAFWYVNKLLVSKVEHIIFDIEDPWNVGEFDVILFYGILYHLKNPLGAMENLAKITSTGGICLLETAMAMNPMNIKSPIAELEYRPGFASDPTNHFYPNEAWIKEAAIQAGFQSVELVSNHSNRATYKLMR